MNYYVVKNNQRINLLDIPTIQFETFRAQLCITKLRPLIFFGADWGENIKLYAALADDEKGEILISSSLTSVLYLRLSKLVLQYSTALLNPIIPNVFSVPPLSSFS